MSGDEKTPRFWYHEAIGAACIALVVDGDVDACHKHLDRAAKINDEHGLGFDNDHEKWIASFERDRK